MKKNNNKYMGNKDTFNLKEFMLLKNNEQDKLIKDTLNKLYEEELDIKNKYIEKVLNVAFDNKDNEMYLPYNLCVKKEGNKLIFNFVKSKNTPLFIIFFLVFLFLCGFATYSGIKFLRYTNLNIDLNGDGIADLNIDLDGDGNCDINCDTNKDKKPDLNIDYQGNRKAIFNVKREDGTIFNKINQDLDGNGVCDLNCDTDNDGWPDINIDLDGDGKPDINIDTNGDGIPDLNVDTNGDGVPDVNIDEDDDGICDRNCAYISGKDKNGELIIGGDDNISLDTAALVVIFENGNNIKLNDLYPDDQTGNVNTKVPDVKFTIENKTDKVLYYNLKWIDVVNTFESNNFWVKVWSDYSGYKQDFKTAPFTNGTLASDIAIAPHTKQSYTVSFTLHGTQDEQNYDQGKSFKGKLTVELKEDK